VSSDKKPGLLYFSLAVVYPPWQGGGTRPPKNKNCFSIKIWRCL